MLQLDDLEDQEVQRLMMEPSAKTVNAASGERFGAMLLMTCAMAQQKTVKDYLSFHTWPTHKVSDVCSACR